MLEARLVILASGLNWTLREALGIRRDLVSACHSITVGFDLERTDGQAIAFRGCSTIRSATTKGSPT